MKHKPVIRGGSWNNNDNNCRVANRNNNNPDNSNNNIGLRVLNAIKVYKVNEKFTLSLTEPEPAGEISAGRAIKIAQFHVPVRKHQMIIRRLVGQQCLEHRNSYSSAALASAWVALALAGCRTGFSRCLIEVKLHA